MLTALLLLAAQTAPCEARLGSYADWKDIPGRNWDLSLTAPGGGSVTVIGAQHMRDPAHKQFAHIAERFAAAAPTRVFFEGPDRGTAENADDAIRTMGESGYLRFLAKQAGLPVASLEPDPVDQIAALRDRFSHDRILMFFVLREAARIRDREGKSGEVLDMLVTAMLAKSAPLVAKAGLTTSITDLASLTAAVAREWPGRDWRTMPDNWFSSIARDPEAGFLTAIAAADSEFRNAHMLRSFADAALKGDKVFVVVGRTHVPMLEPGLRCALAG
ncbi:MAG: hypothetical protein KF730_01340 [Sphingomonas sp.]|uniref:hypothetical protein n=1 Tax=Sphingomonas sp. TaxID=28214 RepID=UPI0025ED480A|nr:hypothetical protein [Sphingomonas sp.]MBX3563196.1 hypothetical protein [Sphingomonas sp.]